MENKRLGSGSYNAMTDVTDGSHTWDNTILRNRKLGHEINIEVDIFAKYIERLLVFKHKENSTEGRVPLTMDWLKSKGY